MQLSDLVGIREFSGIEDGTIREPDGWGGEETCKCIRFTLDGVCYMAVEDPEDGYRSHCKALRISDKEPIIKFPPVLVFAEHRTRGDWEETDDVLVLRDATTSEVILEIGTCNTDDYYPYFHFYYHPESMVCNVARAVVEDLI